MAIGAGHSFIVLLREGYPVNVLPALKAVPEVCTIWCATANPVQVVVTETDLGRGVLGVVDGGSPLGVEGEQDVEERKGLLRADRLQALRRRSARHVVQTAPGAGRGAADQV